jgi:uncharacterized membrane protein
MKNNSQVEIEKLLMKKQVRNINNLHQEQLSFGEKLSDLIALKTGSWSFIIIFIVLLCVWIFINGWVIINKPFDPYPFILLNLILSCIAALQAPIIMMSQNRQEAKDRLRSEQDYLIDEKSEIIIEDLYTKVVELSKQQKALYDLIKNSK